MKLRRALVAVATTAAIAPATLMAAPAAFAYESASPAPSASTTPPDSPSPSTAPAAPSKPPTPSATATPTAAPTAPGAPSPKPSTPVGSPPTPTPEPTACSVRNPAKLTSSISGLPGKIVAGSGWHKFSMTVDNPTHTDVDGVVLWAGVGPTNPNEPAFSTSQVTLQAWNPNLKRWENVSDDGRTADGAFGWTDLQRQSYVTIPLRLNVGPKTPIGKGLTVAGGDYLDKHDNCIGSSYKLYSIEIVAPGTSTTGSKPVEQTGGKVPMPKHTPAKTSANTVPATGVLAHTGAPSQLPMIAGIGGAAIVAGAGAMFVVRRRKAGSAS